MGIKIESFTRIDDKFGGINFYCTKDSKLFWLDYIIRNTKHLTH